ICYQIARAVKQFWAKIGTLVKYKHKQKVEKERSVRMQKHLENLVDQTESYSAKLATDLTTHEAVEKSKASIAEQIAEEKSKQFNINEPSPTNLQSKTEPQHEENIEKLIQEVKEEVID